MSRLKITSVRQWGHFWIMRGYLAGSGWKEYQQQGTVCGIPLRAGYANCERLDQPIFTPTTKEASGHDQPISFQQLVDRTPEGPVRDRLVDIAARMREAVEEAWRIALRGQNLVESRRAIDDTAVRAELASLQGDRTKVAPGEAPPMVQAKVIEDAKGTMQEEEE